MIISMFSYDFISYGFGAFFLMMGWVCPSVAIAQSSDLVSIAVISSDPTTCDQIQKELSKIPYLKKANPIGSELKIIKATCFSHSSDLANEYDFSLELMEQKNGREILVWQPLKQIPKGMKEKVIFSHTIRRVATNLHQRNQILLHFYQVAISSEWNQIYHFTLQQKINPDSGISEEKAPPHYFDTLAGIVGTLGVGSLWYYVELATNSQDFQIYNFWESLKIKLTETQYYGFDDNAVSINLSHAVAGAIYYQFARSSHFNRFESFLWALAASSVWEYGIEFREVISLNDQIFTPLGGMIIGEVLYQFSYFFSKQSTPLGKIVSSIFCPACTLHGFIHKESATTASEDHFSGDGLFVSFNYSEFKGAFEKSLVELSAGFQGRISDQASARPTEQIAYWSSDAIWNQVSLVFHLSPIQMQLGVDFLAQTALAGFVVQKSSKDAQHAYRFAIAPVAAVEVNRQILPGQEEQDFFATVDVIGTNMQVDGYIGKVKVQFSMDVFASFGMIKSLALSEFTGHTPSLESSLGKRGYSWSLGPKVNSSLGVAYGPIDLNFFVQAKDYDSIDGLDGRRNQWEGPMAKERKNNDGRYAFGAELGVAPFKLPLQFVVAVKMDHRWSEMQDVSTPMSYQSVKYSFSTKGKW